VCGSELYRVTAMSRSALLPEWAATPDDYCVVKSTTAMATERLTAETVATVDSTPIRRSDGECDDSGGAVISPICASLISSPVELN